MMTREQYMANYDHAIADGKNFELHHEYFAQFVFPSTKIATASILKEYKYSDEDLIKAYAEDKHLNTIPLSIWDYIGCCLTGSQRLKNLLRETGEGCSKASLVCVAKTACRIYITDLTCQGENI